VQSKLQGRWKTILTPSHRNKTLHFDALDTSTWVGVMVLFAAVFCAIGQVVSMKSPSTQARLKKLVQHDGYPKRRPIS